MRLSSVIHSISNPARYAGSGSGPTSGVIKGVFNNSFNICFPGGLHISVVRSAQGMCPDSIVYKGCSCNKCEHNKRFSECFPDGKQVYIIENGGIFRVVLSRSEQLLLEEEKHVNLFVKPPGTGNLTVDAPGAGNLAIGASGAGNLAVDMPRACALVDDNPVLRNIADRLRCCTEGADCSPFSTERFVKGIRQLERAVKYGVAEDFVGAGRDLGGLGPGFTPAGDDILAGAMAAHVFFAFFFGRDFRKAVTLNQEILKSLKTMWPSCCMLEWAARGGCPRAGYDLFDVFVDWPDSAYKLPETAEQLLSMGSSSGSAYLQGVKTVLHLIITGAVTEDLQE